MSRLTPFDIAHYTWMWRLFERKKTIYTLVSHIFFRNFARIRILSLSKGSWGNWRKMGLRIGDRTQFHILPPEGRSVALQSAINCIKEHPMLSHQPFYDSPSGAKVNNSSERAKSIHIFFFRACSTLLNWLRHFVWHLLEKCVLGYVLLLTDSADIP